MTITYKNFKMVSSDTGKYDLYESYETEKEIRENGKRIKTGENHIVDSLLGYNMSVERCIHKMIDRELYHKQDTMPLREAVKVWNDKYNEIKEHIKF